MTRQYVRYYTYLLFMLYYISTIMLSPNISFYRIAIPIRTKNDFLNTAFNTSFSFHLLLYDYSVSFWPLCPEHIILFSVCSCIFVICCKCSCLQTIIFTVLVWGIIRVIIFRENCSQLSPSFRNPTWALQDQTCSKHRPNCKNHCWVVLNYKMKKKYFTVSI